MKPKVLFIINDLETGGVTKAMTSLLNVIDRNKYDVSLFPLTPDGPFKALLPDDIKVISNPLAEALTHPFKGIPYLLRHKPALLAGHLFRLGVSFFDKANAALMISRLLPVVEGEYDIVVDFGGQFILYYMIDRLKASKKITFFHSDYSQWPYYYKIDKRYYDKADAIFTISEHCVDVMKEWFPKEAHKIGLMENISSLEVINRMACEEVDDMHADAPSLLTIGHVSENKGTDMALEAAAIMKARGVKFHWFFLGANPDEKMYADRVARLGLENDITFLGLRVNPYPYMKKADIVVHPSKFEGKSIALDEVKLLLKPVVVTDFSTVGDQFTDRYNATICDMKPEAIARAVTELLYDERLRDSYRKNLAAGRKDNSDEIAKLYKVFGPE